MTVETKYTLRWADGQEFGPATLATLQQWAREGRVPRDAVLVPADGSATAPVMSVPDLARLVAAPPTVAGAMSAPPPAPDAPLSGLIPYRNTPALVGYYLAVFSLLMGPVLGVPAVILGIVGLVKVRRQPHVRGTAHAIIAIVGGAITSLACGSIWLMVLTNAR
jgi:hypothetical protein